MQILNQLYIREGEEYLEVTFSEKVQSIDIWYTQELESHNKFRMLS